jgi:hypothetical protein
MAVENLGYLAQFLGGMAQGKLLKQKRNAQATELKYKTDKMKADAEESLLRKNYRDAMLGIARRKEDRESKTPANASFLGGEITRAQTTLAEKNKQYTDEFLKEPTVAGRRRVLARARQDIGTAYQNLDNLFALPGVSQLYGDSPIENIRSIARKSVTPYFIDETIEPDMDVSNVYDFKTRRDALQGDISQGYQAGFKSPNYYVNALGPKYLQAVNELSGGDPNLRPAAVQKVISEFGNIPGLSPEGMNQYLTTGRVDLYRPMQVDPTSATGTTTGLFEQLPTEQAQSLLDAQRGDLGGPFTPSKYMLPEQVETGGSVSQYGELPGLASSRVVPTGAFNDVAIPFSVAAQQAKLPGELQKQTLDLALDRGTLEAKVQKARNEATLTGYAVAKAPIELNKAAADMFISQVKAANIGDREKAEIQGILINNTFKANQDIRSSTQLKVNITKTIGDWIAGKTKDLSTAVDYANTNKTRATANLLAGGSAVTSFRDNNQDLYKKIVSGQQDPRTLAQVPADALPILEDIYDAQVAVNQATTAKRQWLDDQKSIGPIIDTWISTLKFDDEQQKTKPKPKPGGKPEAKTGAKPSASVGGNPGMRTPKPNEGVKPAAKTPD